MGKLDWALESVERAKEAGCAALKFQLFPNEYTYTSVGNKWLDPDIFLQCFEKGKEIGLPVSASVFGLNEFLFLKSLKPEFIKFSYGNKDKIFMIEATIAEGIEAIISSDVMTKPNYPEATHLYCLPIYPVPYVVDFTGLFPLFDGFSDHTMGINQTFKAVNAGAKVIEKHVRLDYETNCPDAKFAVTFEELKKLCV
jgi:N-acetylneuraminate synthase/N,N'-diacetyllegionaminate synthase